MGYVVRHDRDYQAGAEASLAYVVDTLHRLRDSIPDCSGPLLFHLLDMMCLEASEVSARLVADRVRASLLRDTFSRTNRKRAVTAFRADEAGAAPRRMRAFADAGNEIGRFPIVPA